MKKIVVIGPESTGKSTLCQALARALQTVWVPEHARGYLLRNGIRYNEEDLLKIASGQLADEDRHAADAHQFLICDTDLYVVKVWSEASFGHCDRRILEQIATRPYDLYLLTYIDIEWEDDVLREHSRPDERYYFYSQYRDIVVNSGIPWADIRGSHEERLQQALQAIDALQCNRDHS